MSVLVSRILVTASLLLAMSPPQVFGRACCGGAATPAPTSSSADDSCDCCKHDQEASSAPCGDPKSPAKPPCKPGCTHWCCGAGFVPLTVIACTPLLERVPGSADQACLPPLLEGFRPRIEHPPRA